MGWYKANCDGDWEHSYGVKIETTEEGRGFQADLADTAYATDDIARRESRRSDADWLVVELHDGAYRASGGGCSLIDIVARVVAYVRVHQHERSSDPDRGVRTEDCSQNLRRRQR